MKALTSLEPKPFKAFRDNYLAVAMMVVALLLSSVLSAQSDELKYSKINGYGFLYKRWGADSILMVPLSSSPHTPYRAGAIRYKAADSTLQLWTGYQWNSILTGVGSGIDTMYMLNDTTLAIETPDQNFFAVIKGQNIANAALTADGDYIQDWADKWFFLHDLKALDLTSNRIDPNHTGNKKTFQFYSDSTADAYPILLGWALRNVNDNQDSLGGNLTFGKNYLQLNNYDGDSYANFYASGNPFFPNAQMFASDGFNQSGLTVGPNTISLAAHDSTRAKLVPAATGDTVVMARSLGFGLNTLIKVPVSAISANLSNQGTGFRWVKTANGQIKTLVPGFGMKVDSTTNTNAITIYADTTSANHLATHSALKDTAAAIRASAGGSQNLDQVLTQGNITTREIISTADISGDSSLFKNFLFSRSGRVGSTTLSTPQPFPVYGSSITVGYGAVSYATIMANDWLQLAVTNNGINGSGISTATPNHLYGRISTLPNYTSNHYGIIFEGCINDFINNADTTVYKAQFGEIVDSARVVRSFPTGKIFLISPPYSPNFKGDSIYIGINQRVAALHGGVAIDIWHPMRDAYVSGHTDIVQSDSLHPTLKGQEIIARTIALAANTGSYYGNLDVSGSDTVRHNRITYGDNTTYGKSILLGHITQPVLNGGRINFMNPGHNNGDYMDLGFIPDSSYHGPGIHEIFFFRHGIAGGYGSTFSLYRKSDNTSWRVLHINPSAQLLLGSDASDPPTLDYTVGLGATYMTSGLAGNFKIEGNASSDAQRLRLYKNSGGLDVAAVGYDATYGLQLGSSTTAGFTVVDISSVDGTTRTPVLHIDHGSTTTQHLGKITVATVDSSAAPENMVWQDPITKELKKAAVPSGGLSGSGTSGRVSYWSGSSSLTSDANYLYSTSNNGTLSIGTANTQGHLNLGGNKNLSSSGANAYFAAATFTDASTAASGTAASYDINLIASPTIAATNSSVTFPVISTLNIVAPTAGTNATITKRYALRLEPSSGNNANLGVSGFIDGVTHLRSGGSGASIAAGAGSGTGASGSVSGGDMAGKIDITTGSSPSTSATVVTITFNATYAAAPTVILTPGNAAAAALTGGTQVFVSSTSTTNFLVTSGSSALGASTQYIWYYHVIQ